MVNYGNGKIYRMPVGNKNYFGFTTMPLCNRRQGHIRDFKKFPNQKVYKAMHEVGMTADDIELIWVEDFPCETKEQARARERYWIEKSGDLNSRLPWKEGITTKQEYERDRYTQFYANNRDEILAKKRDFRSNNRDEYNAYMREKHCEYRKTKWTCPHCDIEMCQPSKARHIRNKHPEQQAS